MSLNSKSIRTRLLSLEDKAKAKFFQGFFKTGKGEYGEGDRFLGLTVPTLRKLAKEYSDLSLPEIEKSLKSPFNEERLLALLILVRRFQKSDQSVKDKVVRLFLKNRRFVNNWNLVDSSAPYILGPHFFERDRKILVQMVKSKSLWDRRIAVLTSFYFIRQNDFADTFRFTEALLKDKEDLMHKACGWMLREIGKRDLKALENFLRKHATRMPRTMLRYAIEHLPKIQRQSYLKLKTKVSEQT